jgi:hypothetical protein
MQADLVAVKKKEPQEQSGKERAEQKTPSSK